MTAAERAELATLRERADRHDAKIAAIFNAMRHACEYAGIPVDDGEEPPPLELISGGLDERLEDVEKRVAVHGDVIEAAYAAEGLPLPAELGGLVTRLDAMERGLVSAYQAAHWPAGDQPAPKRNRHGLRALPDGAP